MPITPLIAYAHVAKTFDDGRVVEFTISYYRGDAYDFVAELQSE